MVKPSIILSVYNKSQLKRDGVCFISGHLKHDFKAIICYFRILLKTTTYVNFNYVKFILSVLVY